MESDGTPMTLSADMFEIDWDELRWHKRLLTSLMADIMPSDAGRIEKLLKLLSDLQEHAARQLGEEMVYGPE
jgi:hypothetical protein